MSSPDESSQLKAGHPPAGESSLLCCLPYSKKIVSNQNLRGSNYAEIIKR